MEMKLISNIIKIVVSISVFIFNIVYFVVNKSIAPIDQQISLCVFVAIIWSVWLPVDASVFVKNLKELKDITK